MPDVSALDLFRAVMDADPTRLPQPEAMVLLALLRTVSQTTWSGWYTQDQLAHWAKMTDRGVRNVLPRLIALGVVRITLKGGPRGTAVATLSPDAILLLAVPTPEPGSGPAASTPEPRSSNPEPGSAEPRSGEEPGSAPPRNQVPVTPEPRSSNPEPGSAEPRSGEEPGSAPPRNQVPVTPEPRSSNPEPGSGDPGTPFLHCAPSVPLLCPAVPLASARASREPGDGPDPPRTIDGRPVPADLAEFGLRPMDLAIIVEYCDSPAELLMRSEAEISRWRGLGPPGAERIAKKCRRAGWPLGCVPKMPPPTPAPPIAATAPPGVSTAITRGAPQQPDESDFSYRFRLKREKREQDEEEQVGNPA